MLKKPNVIRQNSEVTASELIQMLNKFDGDAVVCFPRDEGGFSPIKGVELKLLLENVNNEYWMGAHDELDSVYDIHSYNKNEYLILHK